MFTGLIEETGTIISLQNNILTVQCKKIVQGLQIGDSVAVNGVCLTVMHCQEGQCGFNIAHTTQQHTLFKKSKCHHGERVNLERALLLGGTEGGMTSRLAGHWVTGHVDATVPLLRVTPHTESYELEILLSDDLKPLVAAKGSVALDGVSLTVAQRFSQSFTVAIIPHTWQQTTFKNKRAGDLLHLEVDVLARYVWNILKEGGLHAKN